MDDTLDSIRPSYARNPQAEMSYLFGRDPSILAYGQRPCPSQDSKKNLLSDYEIEECNSVEESTSINSDLPFLQTIKVYLRMKPFPKKLKITKEQQEAYKITSSTTLLTRLPASDNNTSCLKRSSSSDTICRKFTFTKTFGPETTQLDLFEQAVKQQMVDFLAGQNSTIMTYGTTNSGKSYTLQGTTTSPGIIPRGLEFVFSNITPKSMPSYKPVHHCDVVPLDPLERAQELEIKSKLLTFASTDKYQYINAYKEMQKLLQEESPIRPHQCIDVHYSVWVSFAEIYNETVYDLLSNESQKKRTPLKLATDSQGRAFIKGLKTVCVNSGSEAYQVLMAGQYNLKVAATALNARSSRSHCIFTIKLLKYYIENEPDAVEVSTFALCDLAGSERLKKTLNIGDRLKEAQNINTSLLVLGRCLKSIHEGQLTKQKVEHIGPFRESKLTRLFQKALSGKEHIALIVNINPVPNLYVETQNVLSFSAIAKKIEIERKEAVQKKPKTKFARIVMQSINTVTDWDTTDLESEDWQNGNSDDGTSEYIQHEDYEDLVSENERLKKEFAALKSSALARDLQIRQEMADTYIAMMKELEADWRNRIKDVEEQQEDVLQWSVKQVEEFYKHKLDLLSSRKRRRSVASDDNENDDSRNFDELEAKNSRLTSKVVLLKNSIKELKESNQLLNVEKNKSNFELSLTKADLESVKNLLQSIQQDTCTDEDTKFYVEELKSQLFAKQEQVKKLKVFLNVAKEEYIQITTEVREKEYLVKEQEKILVENEEKIEELEAHLEHTNICLTEKTKAVRVLEEKLDSQTKTIIDNEVTIQDMQEQINQLKNEKLLLMDKIDLLQVAPVAEDTAKDTSSNDESERPKDSLKASFSVDTETLDKIKQENSVENSTEVANTLPPDVKEKIDALESENSILRETLVESMTEIQSLKEDLESVKIKIQERSEEIFNMKTSSPISTKTNKASETLMDVSCQVEIKCENVTMNKTETDVESKSSQTTETETREEINQTSFTDETGDAQIVDAWAKLTVKYDDMKALYKQKCLRVEELVEEMSSLKQRIETLTERSRANAVVTEEYKHSIQLLQNELSSNKEDNKKRTNQVLQEADSVKVTLENKIADYERQLNETKMELSSTKDDHNSCMEKLKTLQDDLNSHVLKCKNEHQEKINELQQELSIAKEKTDLKAQCLDVHAAKIVELQHNLKGVNELQEQICLLNLKLEACQCERDSLQSLLNENNDKLLELEDRLENAEGKEREKDEEIISLQKEMKRMIQNTEHDDRSDKIMEREMKNTIKDLAEMKETLCRKQEQVEHLEMSLKSFEQNTKVLELLQQTTQERQEENQRLRKINEELKSSLIEKDHEMEAFIKNRDEMVTKYETLVKNQQEELERQKREFIKPDQKDHLESQIENGVATKERRTRRARKKNVSPPSTNEISLIDLSSSDSKRSEWCAGLLPSNTEPVSDRKKSSRKKKLFVTGDVSFQDIEPHESTITITPSAQPRSLRNRRK